MKRCPFCAEEIQEAAVLCRFCRSDLRPQTHAAVVPAAMVPPRPPARPGVAAVLSLVIPGSGHMYAGDIGTGFVFLFATAFGYLFYIVPGLLLHVAAVLAAARVAQQSPTPANVRSYAPREPSPYGHWLTIVLMVLAVLLTGVLVATVLLRVGGYLP